MNNKQIPPPPREQQIDVMTLIQIRVALASITDPSPSIIETCSTLDGFIVNFARGLKGN
jgi:hypothetical protein